MSGIYLLALIAIWLFFGWVIYRLCRLWQPAGLFEKSLYIGVGVMLFSVWFGGPFWQVTGKKMYWDARVREMCAQDGGEKIYETEKLPEDQFDKWGLVKFYHPSMKELALGSNYKFSWKEIYLREKNPKIIRSHYSIIRNTDEKLLGELIYYVRIGGDLPGFWHGSSYSCPNDAGTNKFLKSIFVKSEGDKK